MGSSERFERIAGVAERHVESGALSGVEWKILRRGTVWAAGRYGLADGLNGVGMPERPIYRIFSMTKPVVSAVAMMLLEQGRLRLFEPLAAYLPEFRDMEVLQADGSVVPAGVITIEHLLTHRAGLSYGFLLDCPVGELYREADLRDAKVSLAEFVRRVAALPLAFQPGSAWRYSVATDVLGRVLEVVLGKDLQDILQTELLQPLAMEDTGFSVPIEKRERLMAMFGVSNLDESMLYDDQPQILIPVDMKAEHPCDDLAFCRGGMGLFSTVEDYAVMAQFLQTGVTPHGERLLSAKSIEMLWTDRIPEAQKPLMIGPFALSGYGWGLAGRVMVDMGQALVPSETGECGWAGAASTFFWIDNKNDLIGVVMTQYIGSKVPIGEDFLTAVYQALDD